jgi:hypothetical protein
MMQIPDPNDPCDRCPVLTKEGERCKNTSCKGTPLCAVHVKRLRFILKDFHNLDENAKSRVLPDIAWYLGSRNIDFTLNAKCKTDEPVDAKRNDLVHKFNNLDSKKKSSVAPQFCTYLALRNMSYQINL